MRLYISVTEDLKEGQSNTTKIIALNKDYNFDQLGEMIRDMADSIRGSTKEELEQMKGEAMSDEERGN